MFGVSVCMFYEKRVKLTNTIAKAYMISGAIFSVPDLVPLEAIGSYLMHLIIIIIILTEANLKLFMYLHKLNKKVVEKNKN